VSKNTILTVGLILVVVGGLTWVGQYMPSWKKRQQGVADPIKPGTDQKVLEFSPRSSRQPGEVSAVFERDESGDDTGYVLEVERGVLGHYYFPFRNGLGAAAEMGLKDQVCNCSESAVCILPADEWKKIDDLLTKTPWADPFSENKGLKWTELVRDEKTGIVVPSNGHGVIRVSWKGRKDPGIPLDIKMRFWSQPEGDVSSRQYTTLDVPAKMAVPFWYEPLKQSAGQLGPGEKRQVEIYGWSSTRDKDKLDVKFESDKDDPLFQVEARPLSLTECQELEKKMRLANTPKGSQKIMPITRVRSGYLIKATVYEQKGKLQMDQGPFLRNVPVILDGHPTEFPTPTVTGMVKGAVDVGGELDQGKVQFKSFPAAEAKTVVLPLYADSQIKLERVEQYPPSLQVELKRHDSKNTSRTQWDLQVTVPARAWAGPLPEKSAVILRIAGDPPRLIRIPVVGNATQ
jgi:hypothetical protein